MYTKYDRRRMTTVVVGVASPSSLCARPCYALVEGVATIIDDQNGEGVSTIYERRRMPTVVVGVASPSFPCARYL